MDFLINTIFAADVHGFTGRNPSQREAEIQISTLMAASVIKEAMRP